MLLHASIAITTTKTYINDLRKMFFEIFPLSIVITSLPAKRPSSTIKGSELGIELTQQDISLEVSLIANPNLDLYHYFSVSSKLIKDIGSQQVKEALFVISS